MKNLVLHIGYHKTATTFLQLSVFARQKQIIYLGVPWRNKSFGEFFRELKYVNDLDFDSRVFSSRISALLDGLQSEIPNEHTPIVASLESLHCGADWFGRDVLTMLDRLARVFHGAKIIIGIRNQKSYIVSNYAEYVIHGGKLAFDEYLNRSFSFNRCLAPKLQYDKVIRLYQERFGSDRVYVYLQEELKADVNNEIRKILEFVSVETIDPWELGVVYSGLSRVAIGFVRLANKVMAKDFTEQYNIVGQQDKWPITEKLRRKTVSVARRMMIGPAASPKSMMKASDCKYVDNMFRESNVRLAELLQKNIKTYGYVH